MTENYVGQELELFSAAVHWKTYFSTQVSKYLSGDVLEVGAGIGANTKFLRSSASTPSNWTCLEPDSALSAQIPREDGVEVQTGTLASLPAEKKFDSILYLDVLEHIEDDTREVEDALAALRPGGHLIVLAPAHSFLFSPFDKAIGHFRRYDRGMMRKLPSTKATVICDRYLDSCGLLLSFANRALLKQTYPNARQIAIWDNFVVPVSKLLDPLLGYSLGKSLLYVWKRH